MSPSELPRPFRVARTDRDLPDTVTLELVADDREAPPPAEPGQFNMLYAFGVGEAAVSLSRVHGAARQHTVRAVGYVSEALCALEVGAGVGVRGPFGEPWPLELARGSDLLLVTGGIGIAPLRPVVDAVRAEREAFGRVALLHGARSPDEILYRGEFDAWRRDLDVRVIVEQHRGGWTGPVGFVPKLVEAASIDPSRTVVFVCGPEVMLRFVFAALARRGVAPDRVFVSLERNHHCATGHCGHCQLGPFFVCRDGPVFRYDRVEPQLGVREL